MQRCQIVSDSIRADILIQIAPDAKVSGQGRLCQTSVGIDPGWEGGDLFVEDVGTAGRLGESSLPACSIWKLFNPAGNLPGIDPNHLLARRAKRFLPVA